MEYKVLITSAGTGSRLGDLSKNINKSLLTIYTKPVISYIIEKFPKNIEIVIAVGYKSALLKDFLEIAYPDRKITTVDVDKFEGPGSGLGYTILKCEEHLQCPFVFCTNDTIILEDVPVPDYNWIGYADVYDNNLYRSLKINDDNRIEDINEKGHKIKSPAAVGIHGIYNYEEFWKSMKEGVSFGSISTGELFGMRDLLCLGIYAKKFTWFDTGCIEGIEKCQKYFDTGEYNLLRKPDESIWFVENKVIKYSFDKQFIKDRIERSKILTLIPKILDHKENMYSYKYSKAQILSRCINLPIFKRLLTELKDFWIPKPLGNEETKLFKTKCFDFYKVKTYKRIENYFIKYDYEDREETINGITVPKVMDLLEKIDWTKISSGIPVCFHGDLHFENILLTEVDKFLLLDWRQNFSDIIEYGDIYYDLAKLLHGIIVSHEMVHKDLYFINDEENMININIYRNQIHVEIEQEFYKFLRDEGYDTKKVRILTALIYLNIATLHHYPYSKFLFFFGKYMLNNILNEST